MRVTSQKGHPRLILVRLTCLAPSRIADLQTPVLDCRWEAWWMRAASPQGLPFHDALHMLLRNRLGLSVSTRPYMKTDKRWTESV